MALVPGIFLQERVHRAFLVDDRPLVRGSSITLDKTTRSPLPAPSAHVPEGTVVVRLTQGMTYVTADDPRGSRCLPAEVKASQPADAAWAGSTIAVGMAGSGALGLAVPLDPQATTTPTVVDQLNRHPLFAAHFVADDQAGLVCVRTREPGAHKVLHVESTLPAAFGPLGTAAHGTDAEYRVTDDAADLRDLTGQPIEGLVPTLAVGHFVEKTLLSLTPEARAVLSRRGSLFR